MSNIPWCPRGLDPQLAAALVPAGKVTEQQWWQALADRVSQLVQRQPDPQEALQRASQALGVVEAENPSQAGQSLVEHNQELRQALVGRLQDLRYPFPASVDQPQERARQAMQEIGLAAGQECLPVDPVSAWTAHRRSRTRSARPGLPDPRSR